MSLDYRNVIYSNYHTTQSGRDKAWNKLVVDQTRFFEKELIPLLPQDKKSSILDIGSGNGSFLKACKNNQYLNLTGVDVSKEQIKLSIQNGIDNVFEANILEWLAASNEKYDVITAIDLIEHLTKDELIQLLLLVKNSLKEKGRFIFRTPNLDCPLPHPYSRGDFSHETFLNKHSAIQVLLATGFQDIDIRQGLIFAGNPLKNFTRKLLFTCMKFTFKLRLFAYGYSSRDIIITPNLIGIGFNPSHADA
jgi:2-polyprenyl-3-methyl-5-hydroxy-6-metoxy-1,4-benzoquinol methylase